MPVEPEIQISFYNSLIILNNIYSKYCNFENKVENTYIIKLIVRILERKIYEEQFKKNKYFFAFLKKREHFFDFDSVLKAFS